MENIKIIPVSKDCINEDMINQLTSVLSYDSPENRENVNSYWNKWLTDQIEGEKITIIAEESSNVTNHWDVVGVVRLWKSPYCGHKWLIEGLEVIAPKRRQGIGSLMVKLGIASLRGMGVDKIHANIHKNNLGSIQLHKTLGFEKTATGTLNSYGDYRENNDEYTLIL